LKLVYIKSKIYFFTFGIAKEGAILKSTGAVAASAKAKNVENIRFYTNI
jgi:hypothetical protein